MNEIWGVVEAEPEVTEWIRSQSEVDFGRIAFYIDLLERSGPALSEPYTRQLSGKLRELRFYLGRDRVRITYYIASGRRIILLTVFKKRQRREESEVERAKRAMQRCIDEGHLAEENVR